MITEILLYLLIGIVIFLILSYLDAKEILDVGMDPEDELSIVFYLLFIFFWPVVLFFLPKLISDNFYKNKK